MKVFFDVALEERDGDVLVLPYWEGPKAAASHPYELALALKDFKGRAGEPALCYGKEGRFLLLGLGVEGSISREAVRRSYSAVVKVAQGKEL